MFTKKLSYIIIRLFAFILILSPILIGSYKVIASTIDGNSLQFIKKVSKDYTNKFCNSISFGLSKESAMNFSLGENKKTFKNRKETKNINKDLLAEEISNSVVEKCGYPINLTGEKGVKEFKIYYLSKDK